MAGTIAAGWAPRSHELQDDHLATIVGQVKILASEPVTVNNRENKLALSHLFDALTCRERLCGGGDRL